MRFPETSSAPPVGSSPKFAAPSQEETVQGPIPFSHKFLLPTAAHHKAGVNRHAVQRILIVDDEPDALQWLRSIVEQAGYATTCVSTLRSALEALEQERFHLVLTDLYLGDDDLGYQLADRSWQQEPPVPVVLLTGKPTFDGAQEALRSRIADIIVKPADAQSIVTTCRRTIQQTELARRNRELHSQNQVLAAVLPRAIEVKDPTTSGHADRVVRYADALAKRCGLSDEDRSALALASLLHDVGKIGIPNSILTKPGALTEDEREIIRRHPAMGYEILEPLQDHDNVRLWVYQHHERWDGRGYPEGLRGDEVALGGRILVLAEVYDALAEPRSYKGAWEIPKITAFFRDQAGKHFDPDLAHLVADGLDRMGSRFFASSPGMLF